MKLYQQDISSCFDCPNFDLIVDTDKHVYTNGCKVTNTIINIDMQIQDNCPLPEKK